MPPAPGVVRGPALLALETSTTPGKAILFFGEVETPELAGVTAVKYSYQALDALDRRTLVGEPLFVGPYPIGEDGRFDARTEPSTRITHSERRLSAAAKAGLSGSATTWVMP